MSERDEALGERDEATRERDELTRERDQLAARVNELEQAGSSEEAEAQRLLQRTLVAAERTADETVHDARATAEQTIADARAQAEEIVSTAQREAAAEQERAQALAAQIQRAVEEFMRFRSDVRERFEAVVAEQLAILDRVELPEAPREFTQLVDQGSGAGGVEEQRSVGQEPRGTDLSQSPHPTARLSQEGASDKGGDARSRDGADEDREATSPPPGPGQAPPAEQDDSARDRDHGSGPGEDGR